MENLICENCNNEIKKGFNFCPICGAALTVSAEKLEKDKTINAQLVILANLIKEVDDTKTLYVIEKYIKKLSKS